MQKAVNGQLSYCKSRLDSFFLKNNIKNQSPPVVIDRIFPADKGKTYIKGKDSILETGINCPNWIQAQGQDKICL